MQASVKFFDLGIFYVTLIFPLSQIAMIIRKYGKMDA